MISRCPADPVAASSTRSPTHLCTLITSEPSCSSTAPTSSPTVRTSTSSLGSRKARIRSSSTRTASRSSVGRALAHPWPTDIRQIVRELDDFRTFTSQVKFGWIESTVKRRFVAHVLDADAPDVTAADIEKHGPFRICPRVSLTPRQMRSARRRRPICKLASDGSPSRTRQCATS